MSREKREGGGDEREAKLVSAEGPEAEEPEEEEEEEGPSEGAPEEGEGAGAGAGNPKISSGISTSSKAKILTGFALYKVLAITALFQYVMISTCPFTFVTFSTYFPPALYVAKVEVTLSEASCKADKDSQLLRAWYSKMAMICCADTFLSNVRAGSDLKALSLGAKMVIPVSVRFAWVWNFSPTPDEPKRLTKVE